MKHRPTVRRLNSMHASQSRIARWRDALASDLRFAFRYFARHKATTAIIVTVLALGTGANALIFSTFQAWFLRPAPAMPNDGAQERIWAQQRDTRSGAWHPRGLSQPELERLAGRREVFQDVAAWMQEDVILGGDSVPVRAVSAQFVTSNYFAVLGVPLAAGAGFPSEDEAAPVAVLSYLAAQRLFGSARDAVGRDTRVNDVLVRVVGVAPPRFQGPLQNMNEPAVWMQLRSRAAVERVAPSWLTDEAALSAITRLAPGASRERATSIAREVVSGTLPDSAARVGMTRTADVLGMREPPPGPDRNEIIIAFTMILTVGILILLVAWTNVSSLMVAAAVGRRHEVAVRLSLGASRLRLVRQLVTESTLLALAGGIIGLTLAWQVLAWQMRTEIDGVNLAPDAVTFGFVLALAVATGILFGLSPALHATGGGVATALRDSGSGGASRRSRLQRGFVVAQIALSQPLLVLLGTMIALVIADYRPSSPEMARHVIAARFRPLQTGAVGQRREAVDSLVPRIAALPEVLAAVPEASAFAIRRVVSPGRVEVPGNAMPTIVHVEAAAPGWLGVVDVPIVLGRDVVLADSSAAQWPVVIGSDLARVLWAAANPVGQDLPSPALHELGQDSMTLTVVGVYDATHELPGMAWQGTPTRASVTAKTFRVYTAHGREWSHENILVRTRGPAAPFGPQLERFLRGAAPGLPVGSVQTVAQEGERQYRDMLQVSALAGAGGALALLLASLGLYGVVSLSVRQRTREIGIRIAVGAAPMRVARGFLASGVRLGLVALAVGLPLSIAGLKIGLSQQVIIAPAVNPYLIGAAIALVLLAVAATATWLPARRAADVDPASTLRTE